MQIGGWKANLSTSQEERGGVLSLELRQLMDLSSTDELITSRIDIWKSQIPLIPAPKLSMSGLLLFSVIYDLKWGVFGFWIDS